MHIICTNLTIFYTEKHLYSDNIHFLHSLTPVITISGLYFWGIIISLSTQGRVFGWLIFKKTPSMNSIIMGGFTYRVFWVMTFTAVTGVQMIIYLFYFRFLSGFPSSFWPGSRKYLRGARLLFGVRIHTLW